MEDKISYEELEAKLKKAEAKYLESQDERWRQGKRIKELEAKLGDEAHTNEQVKGYKDTIKEAKDKVLELNKELKQKDKEILQIENGNTSKMQELNKAMNQAQSKIKEVEGIANDRKEALDKQSEHIEYIEGVLNEYISAVENVNNGVAAALANGRQLQKYTLAKIRGDN